jgi:hypothetical protein
LLIIFGFNRIMRKFWPLGVLNYTYESLFLKGGRKLHIAGRNRSKAMAFAIMDELIPN